MSEVRTSTTHPLRVSFLALGLPGRIGMTLAPGKGQLAKGGYRWERDLDVDLDRLAAVYRVDLLVCLLENHELERLGIQELPRGAEKRGMRVHRFPIPDGGTPPTARSLVPMIRSIRVDLDAGKTVVVHCAGGLGRTGTVAGCLMRDMGLPFDEVLAALVKARGPRCPENDLQRRFIERWVPSARTSSGSSTPDWRSRMRGAVLGAAIGDAMGAPVEFIGSVAAIRRQFGPDGVTGFVDLGRSGGGRRCARYTDDTQMAEAVLRALLDTCSDSVDLSRTMEAIAERFVEWSRHPQGGQRDPGRACLSGCRALERGVPWAEAGGATAGGCGSVMRAYPFGLVFARDEERAGTWAAEHSRMTHRDPIALAGCAAMAVGIARLVRGVGDAEVLDGMVEAARSHSDRTAAMMEQAIEEARRGVGPEVTLDRLRAWAAHEAIAAGVYLLARHGDDTRSGILEGANTPGDSDSIATIAGALLGARNGIESIPSDWNRDVERGADFDALAQQVIRDHPLEIEG